MAGITTGEQINASGEADDLAKRRRRDGEGIAEFLERITSGSGGGGGDADFDVPPGGHRCYARRADGRLCQAIVFSVEDRCYHHRPPLTKERYRLRYVDRRIVAVNELISNAEARVLNSMRLVAVNPEAKHRYLLRRRRLYVDKLRGELDLLRGEHTALHNQIEEYLRQRNAANASPFEVG